MGRLSRIRAGLHLRAALAGLAVTVGTFVPVETLYGPLVLESDLPLPAVTVLATALLWTPPAFGGAVTGYLGVEDRTRSLLHGAAVGFLPGFLIGAGLFLAFVIGTRVHPPPTYTAVEIVQLVVVLPGAAGVVVGLYMAAGSTLGCLLGFEIRRRWVAEDRDDARRGLE